MLLSSKRSKGDWPNKYFSPRPGTFRLLLRRLRAGAGQELRVCRAWPVSRQVKALRQVFAEPKARGNGKGITATSSLKEAEPKAAGRRTGTRSEACYTWGERAGDREALGFGSCIALPPASRQSSTCRRGVLCKSGVHDVKDTSLAPGDLHRAPGRS